VNLRTTCSDAIGAFGVRCGIWSGLAIAGCSGFWVLVVSGA